jgi:predicted ATP-dependent protease
MPLTFDLQYADVLRQARQLPPEYRERLTLALHKSEPDAPQNRSVLASSLTQEQWEQNRIDLIARAATCPIATEEEIRQQDEAIKEFQQWRF